MSGQLDGFPFNLWIKIYIGNDVINRAHYGESVSVPMVGELVRIRLPGGGAGDYRVVQRLFDYRYAPSELTVALTVESLG